MGELADILDKVKGDGSVTVPSLRTYVKEEETKLEEIDSHTLKGGNFMSAKDALEGETEEAKMGSYRQRLKELAEATKHLYEYDQIMAERENYRKAMPEREFTGKGDDRPMRVEIVSPFSKSVGSELHAAGVYVDYDFQNRKSYSVRAADVIHQLKAVTYTGLPGGGRENVEGLLPSDRIVDIYPMNLEPLDYFTMRAEPGAIIRYNTPEDPIRPDGTTGNAQYDATRGLTGDAMSDIPGYGTVTGARVRIRGSRLGERLITRPTVVLPKQSEGVMTFVNREDINDNPQIWQKTADQLMLDVRQLLMYQLFYGSGTLAPGTGNVGATTPTTGQWNGIDPFISSTAADKAANISQFNQDNDWHNQVDVVAAASGIVDEPLAFLEELFVRMRYAGMNPTSIMLGAADWTRIRQSQRSYRYQNPDYHRYPNGEMLGVPLVINPFAAANTLHVFDTRPDVTEIILGQEIQTDVSEDFDFGNNRTTMRVVVYGNIPIYKKYGLVKVTQTNLFKPQTTP